jgi:hypothetical protein
MNPAPAHEPLPPALYAVIVAAVHIACGGPNRILSLCRAPDADWAREGRRDIFVSHRVR